MREVPLAPAAYGSATRPALGQPHFFDTGLVRGDAGVRLENAVAGMLLKHVHFQQDARGQDAGLHYLRTKDGAEVDFCLSRGETLTHLVECKLGDTAPHRALTRFAAQFPQAQALQLVLGARHGESRPPVQIERAAEGLVRLDA